MVLPRILAASLALSALPGAALAQASSSQVATGTGTIFLPIVLSKDTDLEFGTVVRPPNGSGSVTIDATTGERTLSGQGALLSGGASPSPASFSVGGEGGQTFSITAPSSMTITRAGGGETLVVALTPSATSGVLSGTPGGAGEATFGVGGSLPMTNATIAGAYTGSFTVTVAYN